MRTSIFAPCYLCRTLVRNQLNRFRGREIETTGDGFLATFDGPARAIRCAHEIARTGKGIGISVRTGLHTGEVELCEDEVRGLPCIWLRE
jgi:class 3 adenylate cyclase